MAWLRRLCAALALTSSTGWFATALPWEQPPFDDYYPSNSSDPFAEFPPVVKARQDEKTELRILPLGASIMSGQGSTEGSGLRKWIRMALRHDDWPVNMVGSRNTGRDMVDNDHEAKPGATIVKIGEYLENSLGYRPNIVMINGGTNNANWGEDVDKAYDQMNSILQRIWTVDDGVMAKTCIILSTLLPTSDRKGMVNRITMNEQYRRLVRDHQDERCIYLADMEPPGEGADYISVNGDYWDDDPKVHPNDAGHKRMAYVFYAAIHRALSKVKPAAKMTETTATVCDKEEAGNGIYAGGLTQKGWGHHDGTYKHSSTSMEILKPEPAITTDWDRNQWRFARLYSEQYDDLLGWFEYDENDHRFGVWKNSADGLGNFRKLGVDMKPEHYCIPRGLHFIDMNADGLDDLLTIRHIYTWTWHGLIRSTGAEQKRIRLADIDGDGRGDYGVVNDDLSINFWRNGWVDDTPKYWQPLGVRSTLTVGVSLDATLDGLRFTDINGDGRDDWMYMRGSGQTTIYTNTRSCKKGQEGDGLNVAWRKAANKGSDKYVHFGMEEWHDADNWDLRERIHLARIYGRRTAFGGLAVRDYVFMESIDNPDDGLKYKINMRAWSNTGAGGTKLIADGNKYCNMMGHEGHQMDYVWTWSWGKMHIFPNAEKRIIQDPESYWGPETVMWTPPTNLDRRDLHLADWNDDGVCDIIYADLENGNVRVWINHYPEEGTWNNAFREIDPPNLSCPKENKRGIGIHDVNVRFADITGNGRADYLCLSKNGKVMGNLHEDDDSFGSTIQIKFSETMDRANLRWEDVNGDGRADMIWIDKFNGDGYVWENDGPADPEKMGGSHFHWIPLGNKYQGSQAGTCMFFPDLDGDGRADMHGILGTWTNEAETWYNPPCGLSDVTGDGDDGRDDPRFEPQPGNPIGGPGPGEDGNDAGGDPEHPSDCVNLDDRPWRDLGCDIDVIEYPTFYDSKRRWEEAQADDAWQSALEFAFCRERFPGAPSVGFSAVVSDFLGGPSTMSCETWEDKGNMCDGNLQCIENATTAAASELILNSFATVHAINWNLGQAIDDAVNYINVDSLAIDFGLVAKKTMNPSLQIMLDIFLMVFGMVGGIHWNLNFRGPNKGKQPGGPVMEPPEGGWDFNDMGALKDTVNDMVKSSITMGKDIYAKLNPAGDSGAISSQVFEAISNLGTAWRNATKDANDFVFSGTAQGNVALTTLMEEGKMINTTLGGDNTEAVEEMKRALAAVVIPQTWALSPDSIFPFVVREELACDKSPSLPWTSDSMRWMTGGAYDTRVCDGDTSYWLLGPNDYKANCGPNGGDNPKCSAWGNPPGYSRLTAQPPTYKISDRDIVLGSVATWEDNGRRNGAPSPEATTEYLDRLMRDNIATPGVFRLPVCTLSEARHNWYEVYSSNGPLIPGTITPWPEFPCDRVE